MKKVFGFIVVASFVFAIASCVWSTDEKYPITNSEQRASKDIDTVLPDTISTTHEDTAKYPIGFDVTVADWSDTTIYYVPKK